MNDDVVALILAALACIAAHLTLIVLLIRLIAHRDLR